MNKVYKFIRHNCGLFFSVPICFLVLFYCYSCQSTVVSLVNPGSRITRAELVLEVDHFLSSAELKFHDLDRQDLVKNTIFNSVLELAQGKAVNPIGILITLAGIVGLGAVGDNIRKRTHINTLKGESLNAKVKEEVERIVQRPPA